MKTFLIIVLGMAMSGCYLTRQGAAQVELLLARTHIPLLLTDPSSNLTEAERHHLELALRARHFAERAGLNVGRAYLSYARTERDPLVWVVTASPPDRLVPVMWKFPVVGAVPYLGFSHEEEARSMASSLEEQGLETDVRGSIAFSTLGWFDDPITTPLLSRGDVTLVTTIFHELVHRTVWIPGDVALNESLAQAVAIELAIDFFTEEGSNTGWDAPAMARLVDAARRRTFDYAASAIVRRGKRELSELYEKKLSGTELATRRAAIFSSLNHELRRSFPTTTLFDTPNNALFIGIAIYLADLDRYADRFATAGRRWPEIMAELGKLDSVPAPSSP